MRNWKKKIIIIPKHIYIYILKKKPSILIRVIKKNKNSLWEREREREYSPFFFFFGDKKHGLKREKWYQIYTNKIERRRVKLWKRENDEGSVTVK